MVCEYDVFLPGGELMEYIEREAAKRIVDDIDTWSSGWRNYAKLQMDSIPAADVVPVRHGRWIKVDDGIYYHMECSICHERPLRNRWVDDDELSSHCPNCGANMKGGDGE